MNNARLIFMVAQHKPIHTGGGGTHWPPVGHSVATAVVERCERDVDASLILDRLVDHGETSDIPGSAVIAFASRSPPTFLMGWTGAGDTL